MKYPLKTILLLLITFCFCSMARAQENTGITFSTTTVDGNWVVRNAGNQKVIHFFITGLNKNEDVDAFVTLFKKMKLVTDVIISYDVIDNHREGTVIFQSDAAPLYIKNAMLYSEVKQVIIDGKQINTNDILLEDIESATENEIHNSK